MPIKTFNDKLDLVIKHSGVETETEMLEERKRDATKQINKSQKSTCLGSGNPDKVKTCNGIFDDLVDKVEVSYEDLEASYADLQKLLQTKRAKLEKYFTYIWRAVMSGKPSKYTVCVV